MKQRNCPSRFDCNGCGCCQEFQEYNGDYDPADDHDEYGGISWVGDEEYFTPSEGE